eukprot:TCALIF_00216-PA protein Name:"Protein of unknown function" AED:0.38 eAED:0.38 QI:0/0/0/0.66/0/0.33/3/0/189
MSDVNLVMKDRRHKIARICDEDLKAIGVGMSINAKFMIYDKSHKLAYCAIPKMVRLFIIWKFRLQPPKRHFESWMADQLMQEHERAVRNGSIANFGSNDPTNATHLEHLHRDTSYFLQKANVSQLLQTRIHLNSRAFSSQSSKRQSEADFWSQIKPKTQEELYKLYYYDFQLFGYSLSDYMTDIGLKSS